MAAGTSDDMNTVYAEDHPTGAFRSSRSGWLGWGLFPFLLLPLFALLLVAAWLYGNSQVRNDLHVLEARHQNSVDRITSDMVSRLDHAIHEVLFIAHNPLLDIVLERPDKANTARLTQQWITFSKTHKSYDQIRWLDETGMERLRVDYRPDEPIRVPADELQNKQDRYYFTETGKLQVGEVYISPLDLNIEHGEIERPFKPTVRIATPVTDASGKRRGIIVVNYFGAELLDAVDRDQTTSQHLFVVNSQGYWLKSPNPEDNWGFMLQRPQLTLASRYPAVWTQILSQRRGAVDAVGGRWFWNTVIPEHEHEVFAKQQTGDALFWKVISRLGETEIGQVTSAVWVRIASWTLLFALVLSVMIWKIAKSESQLIRVGKQQATMLADLRLSQSQLHEANRLARIGHWHWDLQSGAHFWSDEIFDLYEQDKASGPLSYPEVSRIFHPASWTRLAAAVERCLKQGTAYECDAEIVRHDGSRRWITARGEAIRGENGTITMLRGTVQDISDRKQTELELHAGEERLRHLVETSNDWIWEVDAEGRYTYSSPGVFRLLGLKPQEVLGRTPFDFMDPDEAERVGDIFKASAVERQPINRLEKLVRHRDGHRVTLETTGVPILDETGALSGYRGTDRDITEQRRSEDKLRENALRYRTLLDHLPQLVWQKDAESVYVTCNSSYARALNMEPAELVGKSDLDVYPADLAAKYRADDERIVQTGNTETFEESWLRDGEERYVRTTKVPLRDEAGRVYGSLGITEDITERRLADLELRKLSLAVAQSPESIVITDLECRIEYVNQAFADRTGYQQQEVLGQNPRLLQSGKTPRATFQSMWDTLTQGRSWRGEFVNRRKNGTEFMELAVITPVRQPDGQISHYVAVKTDITARKRLEAEVESHRHHLEELVQARTSELEAARISAEEAENMLRMVLDTIPVRVFWKDLALRYLGCNQSFAGDSGFAAPDELIGRDDFQMGWRNEAKLYQADDRLVIDNDQPKLSFEEPQTTPGGDTIWLRTSKIPLKNTQGQKVGILGTYEVITEQKEAQQELQQSREKYQRLVDDIGGDFVIYSHHPHTGELTYVSDGIEATFGISREETIGNPWMTLVDWKQEDLPAVFEGVTQLIQGERNFAHFHLRFIHPNGELRYLEATTHAARNELGEVISIDGIVQNVTENKRIEADLLAARKKAEAAVKAKSEFLANMSHEIRTPLNAVLGLARIGVRENAGRRTEVTCRRIQEAGEHLLGVINDILDFSRLEADKLHIESLPFKLSAVLSDTRDLVRDAAKGKGLDWVLDSAPDVPPWVLGDPQRLRQILINLLSNAVKFTERGEVRLRVAREGDDLAFQVIDTGIGMSAEQIGELFQPFQQADSSTTRRFGGSGLGLVISQRLARLMGGEVHAESGPGGGSRFTLRLPLPAAEAPAHADPKHPASHADGPRLARLKVLAAEDMPDNRLILEDLLHQEGADVTFAENGRQALDLLQERGAGAFDLVLMDIQMPVMDGYQASEAIREMIPGLPVIGLTAHALAEERERCLAAGMVEHVTKPIDPDQLVAAIRRHATAAGSVERQKRQPGLDTERLPEAGTGVPGDSAGSEEVRDGMIDRPALLARYGGRLAFIEKLLATSRVSHAEGPERLREAARQGDLEAVRFLAHSLKGLGGNLEAPSLRALAIETEQAAREGQDEAAGLALKLAGRLQQLLGEMEEA